MDNNLPLLRSHLMRCRRVLILSCGNPARGDDGIGPWLHRQLRRRINRNGWQNWISLAQSYQWQPEDALSFEADDLVFFIDADRQAPHPYRLQQVEPSDGLLAHTHGFSPDQLLAAAEKIGAPLPVGAWQWGIAAENFELGGALSAPTRQAGTQALTAIMCLLRRIQENDRLRVSRLPKCAGALPRPCAAPRPVRPG